MALETLRVPMDLWTTQLIGTIWYRGKSRLLRGRGVGVDHYWSLLIVEGDLCQILAEPTPRLLQCPLIGPFGGCEKRLGHRNPTGQGSLRSLRVGILTSYKS